MKKFEFDDKGLLKPSADQSGKPEIDLPKEEIPTFLLSNQALQCLAVALNNAICKQEDISKQMSELEFMPAPNRRLYIKNPPFVQLTPELEEKVKKAYFQRLEDKKDATV